MSDIKVTKMGPNTSFLELDGVKIGCVYPCNRGWRGMDTSRSFEHISVGGWDGFKYKKEAIDAVVKSAQQVVEELT